MTVGKPGGRHSVFLSTCFQGVCKLTPLKCVSLAFAVALADLVLSLVCRGKQMAATKNWSKKKLPCLSLSGKKALLNSNIKRKGMRSEQRKLRGFGTSGKTHDLCA